MIEVIPITHRAEWLRTRLEAVNASEEAALQGIHPYLSALELYFQKSAAVVNGDQKATGPQERGILLEPVAFAKLRRDHPDWIIHEPNKYYRDPTRRLGCTPDAFIERPDRPGTGVLQVKSVEPSIFRKNWRNEQGEVTPPMWIVVQAAIEQELTGAAYAMVVPLVVGFTIEVHEIDIPHEPALIQRIEADVREFWTRVENRRPPDVTSPRDTEVLSTLYRAIGGTIDLRGDNQLTELADEDDDLKSQIKLADERRKIIKGRFQAAMGDAGVGLLSDGRCIIRQMIDRKAYSVDAKSFIQITVKEPRE